MSLEVRSFQFGDFLLDPREKILYREMAPVPITPKAFLLLQTLLENHGHLVEKESLVRVLWPDSVVEDGNLSFTVNLVRKAIGDNSQKPLFIETVPRRGYRFIFEVTEHFPARNGVPPIQDPSNGLQPQAIWAKNYGPIAAAGVLLLIVVASLLIGSRYLGKSENTEAAILSSPFGMEEVSANGRTLGATVSRDGKNVVFVDMSSGRQSVWIRQLQSNTNVELIPPSDENYGGFAFSHDGSTLFFARGQFGGIHDVFRMPVIGGAPVRIITGVEGRPDVSPDDNSVSFVRCFRRDDDFCSLFVADAADGKNEKRLVMRPRPFRIGPPKFSPDGKVLAFAVGQSADQSNDFALFKVDIETGSESQLSPERFFNINGVAWLPRNGDLLLTASKTPRTHHYRIWRISAASGTAEPVTKDSDTYSGLNIDNSGNVLVATRIEQDFQLNIFQIGDPGKPRVLANSAQADIAANGRITFTSRQTGNNEIWSVNIDGTGKKQLTSNPADDGSPVVSADGNTIVFSSNRSGESQVWQMKADGSSQVQVTEVEGGYPRAVTPDGWVYYLSGRDRALRRVRVNGGDEQAALDPSIKIRYVAFSADSSIISFVTNRNGIRIFKVVSMPSGSEMNEFPLADQSADVAGLDWSADGRSFAYVLVFGGRGTLWRQPLEGGKPTNVGDLGPDIPGEQSGFSCSPDGKHFTLSKGGWKHDAVLFTGLK